MSCLRCAAANPADAKFCRACGARLGAACPACGHGNLPDSRFCTECGGPLAGAGPFGPPAAYTPPHLAGRIRTLADGLDGERKHVTILFADLRGSMEMLAGRDPEEARQVLDPVLERMMEAVHHYEGTVNQVMGDGIMAIFGAPLAHEDHAVRACYAALRMLQSIERHAVDLRRTRGADAQIRIGINSGEVVVRSISTELHMDYSAVGQTTHVAARMEALAAPGRIFISATTAGLAEGYISARPMGPAVVKGLAEPVEVYELIGLGPVRSRLEAAAARGLSRFVGRQRELAALEAIRERAAGGTGQLAAVVGEPGVGKSRLVLEFVRGPAAQGWLVLHAAGLPYARTTAYLPVITLLRRSLALGEGEGPAAVASAVRAAVGPAWARFRPPLLALLEAPVDDDPRWLALDSDQRRRRTIEAVRHLLVERSRRQPVCLVVEDLHWIDPETQAVLDSLVDGLPTSRILLVVTWRPEYQHTWGNKSSVTQIRLDPLSRAGAEELLREIVGDSPELAPLHGLLIEQTEGNPFFIEESVRNFVETGVLAGAPGAFRLARLPERPQVPVTVHAVLAARIDRLLPDDKRLLQVASAVGKEVPLPLLQAVAARPEDEMERSLTRLQSGEFLHEVRLLPEPEYTFRHALTLEVAYGSLLRERRCALDARIVEALERRRPPGGPAEDLDRLAHHALRGEVWEKAFLYCREAGRRAFARSAHRAAAAYFEQALGALAHLPETRETIEHGVDVRLELRYALSPLGEYRKILATLTEAERAAERLADSRRRGLVAAFLTNFFTLRGDFDRAIEYGRPAMLSPGSGDLTVNVLTHAFLGLAHFGKGEYRHALDLAGRNLDLLGGPRARERFGMALLPSVYSRTIMAWSYAERGEFTDGLRVGAEAIGIAEAADNAHSLAFAYHGAGTVHLRRGDLHEAVAVLERGWALCQLADLPAVLLELAGPLASAYCAAGRAGEAIGLLEEAIGQAIAMRHRIGHWLRAGGLGEAYLCAGQVEEALPLAQMYVEITRLVNARGSHAWALRLLGEAAARRQPPDLAPAESALAAALALAGELGMRPLEGRCHLALGLLHRRAGDSARARAALARAAAGFAALDMRGLLAETEAARAELGA